MALDPRIIMGVRQPDVVGAFDRGAMAAQRQNAVGDQNKLRQLFQEQGPQLAAGQPDAVNAFARLDPGAAQGMMAQREQMDQRRQVARMQAEKYAASISAEQAAQEAAELERAVIGAIRFYQTGDLEGVNRVLTEIGEQPLSSMEEFPGVAAIYGDALGVLKNVGEVTAGPEPADEYQRYVQEEIAAGRQPLSRIEYKKAIQPSGPQTVVENRISTGGEGEKFYNKLDEQQATMFNGLISDGITAGRSLGMIDRLSAMLEATPTGLVGAAQAMLGDFGIETEGLSEIQAARALINQLVPAQRPPGSGPMSDADLELFKQSLPRIINQPGGNALIIDTMKGIAQYQKRQAEIAELVAAREISPTEARKQLRSLVNPIDDFTNRRKSFPNQPSQPVAATTSPAGGYTVTKDDEDLIRKLLEGGE